MNFLTQQQELGAQVGLDQTVTADATLLKRWLNTSQRMILQAYDWPFLRSPTPLVLQTVADVTTGTVATTAGSTTITFSSGPAASVAGRYIRTSSSDDWYKISSHTAGATSATLEIAAIYTAAAATFTVRKFYNSVGTSAVDRILAIKQSVSPYQLTEVSKDEFDRIRPDPETTGSPRVFMMAGKDSSDYWQFILWPTPDAVINLYVEYLLAGTDLSSDSDTSIIPAKWHTSVMIQGAKAQAFDFLDDTRAPNAWKIFGDMLDAMKKNYEPSKSKMRILGSVDNQGSSRFLPFPDGYPYVR